MAWVNDLWGIGEGAVKSQLIVNDFCQFYIDYQVSEVELELKEG